MQLFDIMKSFIFFASGRFFNAKGLLLISATAELIRRLRQDGFKHPRRAEISAFPRSQKRALAKIDIRSQNKRFYPPSPEDHDSKVVDEWRIKGGYPATVSLRGEASARFRRSTRRNHGCKALPLCGIRKGLHFLCKPMVFHKKAY